MEASTKERLTGALIFVAAVIVIVPEMLSGPGTQPAGSVVVPAEPADAGPPLRTVNMTLDDAAGPRVVAPEAPAPAVPAVPAVQHPVVPQPAAEPQHVMVAPAAARTATTTTPAVPAPATTSAGGSWWLRIGLFASRDNAERLVKKLSAAGFAVDLDKQSVGGKDRYRVRAGPVRDRGEALALQARLKASGNDSLLLPP